MSRPSPMQFFGRLATTCLVLVTMTAGHRAIAANAPFEARFPADAPHQYVTGSNLPLDFEVRGAVPSNGDVLVLVWSQTQRRMLHDFAHKLRSAPWQISSEKLEQLPVGRYQLQLMSRIDGQIRTKRVHMLNKVETPQRAAGAALPDIAFDAAPATYTIGSGMNLDFGISNPPERADVVVQVWLPQQKRLLAGFAHTIEGRPWQVSAAKLNTLPEGPVELQLLLRSRNHVVRVVKHTMNIVRPKPVVPAASFVNAPAEYVRGSGGSIDLSLDGDMPENSDVLVLAWSWEQEKMVRAFAHDLDQAPWRIEAARLDLLPAGRNNLQLLMRLDNHIVTKVEHTIIVKEPLPTIDIAFDGAASTYTLGSGADIALTLSAALPQEGRVQISAQPAAGGAGAGLSHEMAQGPWTVPANWLDALPPGQVTLRAKVLYGEHVLDAAAMSLSVQAPPAPEPEPTPEPELETEPEADVNPEPASDPVTVEFASGMSSVYQKGSGVGIDVVVNGSLASNMDVVAIAWSESERKLVDGFGHKLSEPWMITPAQLDKLPDGSAELQLLVREDFHVQKIIRRAIIVLPASQPQPNEGGEPDVVEEPAAPSTSETDGEAGAGDDANVPGDSEGVEAPAQDVDDPQQEIGDQSDPLDEEVTTPPADAGWTIFTRSPDARVIYVSQDGDDANDGLTPQTAVRTSARGYELVRDGYPDHLLFRAGDSFEELPDWLKSGRSEAEPMLVGAYGDGPRPLFGPQLINVCYRPSYGELTVKHVAFVGLAARGDGDGTGLRWMMACRDIRFEDCRIENYRDNMVFQTLDAEHPVTDVTLYRCIVLNASAGGDKSQGLYASGTDGLVIEQCVFDHNGWAAGYPNQMNKFSHNLYIAVGNSNVTVRGNVLARAGSHGLQLRCGGVVEKNLVAGNPIAFYVSRADSIVRGNVVLSGVDMGSENRGWGIDIGTAAGMERAIVENNIVAINRGGAGMPGINVHPATQQVWLRYNVVWDWYDYEGRGIVAAQEQIAESRGNLTSPGTPYVDPGRCIATYMESLGYDASLAAFLDQAGSRPRGVWWQDFSAEAANHYIRQGYTLHPYD